MSVLLECWILQESKKNGQHGVRSSWLRQEDQVLRISYLVSSQSHRPMMKLSLLYIMQEDNACNSDKGLFDIMEFQRASQ
jgi:hypothetical protein